MEEKVIIFVPDAAMNKTNFEESCISNLHKTLRAKFQMMKHSKHLLVQNNQSSRKRKAKVNNHAPYIRQNQKLKKGARILRS